MMKTEKTSKPNDETDEPVAQSKFEMAMMKRHSETRKTVCFTPINWDFDGGESSKSTVKKEPDGKSKDFSKLYGKNTNQEMHSSNLLCRSCFLCDTKKEPHLVIHYQKHHPNHEIPIARPSPQMANRLRIQQNEKFKLKNGLVSGICYFCETNKSMTKPNWARHLLTHTGELKFHCSRCEVSLAVKSHHLTSCPGQPENIFHPHSSNGSLVGFMCKDCNYLQIRREQLVKHLENEHGYMDVAEQHHFGQFILVPDFADAKKRK